MLSESLRVFDLMTPPMSATVFSWPMKLRQQSDLNVNPRVSYPDQIPSRLLVPPFKKHLSRLQLLQPSHIEKISLIFYTPVDKPSFIAERARCAYIAAVSRADLSVGFSVCSQYLNRGFKAVNQLIKFIHQTISTVDTALLFVTLDYKTINLAVFTDASFANNPGPVV